VILADGVRQLITNQGRNLHKGPFFSTYAAPARRSDSQGLRYGIGTPEQFFRDWKERSSVGRATRCRGAARPAGLHRCAIKNKLLDLIRKNFIIFDAVRRKFAPHQFSREGQHRNARQA